MLNNRSILITGGTGSFGKAFVQQLLKLHPDVARLVIFSRDELKQYEMAQEFSPATYPAIRYFIGDVRDATRLRRALRGHRHRRSRRRAQAGAGRRIQPVRVHQDQRPRRAEPDRRLPRQRREARRRAVHRQGRRARSTSTAPPSCARTSCSSPPTTSRAARDLRFSVVRYGNVMGSRGSVIPFFLEQRAHAACCRSPTRDMTRFNISLEEGVDMVLWAHRERLGRRDPRAEDSVVPHRRRGRRAIGPECEQKIVGIRPGEKLHEEMITASDSFNTVDLGRYLRDPAVIGRRAQRSTTTCAQRRRERGAAGLRLQQRHATPIS